MNDYVLFVLCSAIVAIGLVAALKLKGHPLKKGPKGGIIGFILFGAIVGGVAQCAKADVEYFAFGEVYLGLDRTFDSPSPQCEPDDIQGNGAFDRLTSNGGIRINAIKYKGFQINGKYTHHSGATCDDNLIYDAIGIETVYKLWSR